MRKILIAVLLAAGVFRAFEAPLRPASAQADRLERLLQRMTLDQRIGQLFMVSFSGPVNDRAREFLEAMQPGAFALFSSNGTQPEQVTRFVNELQTIATNTAARVPLIMAIDHEGGTVRRLRDGFSTLPWGGALGAMPRADAVSVGALAAQELRAVGITMNLAPVTDVRSDPAQRFMEKRTFGHDPRQVGQAVAAYAQGLQLNGVIAVLKHFPGHGAADDSHTVLPLVTASRDQLRAIDLVPFQMGIEAGADTVMLGHLVVPALEPAPDWPASLSAAVINQTLRGDLGFQGVVMTDALDMGAIVDNIRQPEAAVMALQAGVDMLVAGPHASLTTQVEMKAAVMDAVLQGKIGLRRVDEAVRRVLTLKLKYGLLDWQPLDPRQAEARISLDAHRTQIDALYLNAVAIAKDDRRHLPITGGRRALLVFPGAFPATQRACAALDPNSRAFAYSLRPTPTEIAQAKTSARDVEVVVVFTYNIHDHAPQADLVNALPPEKLVVVALESPYDIEAGIQPGSYVAAFNAEPGAFKAACAVLFGQHPATGAWSLP